MYSDNQSHGGNDGDLRKDFYKLSLLEKVKMLNRLQSLLVDYFGEQASQQPTATPTPDLAPTVEEAPTDDLPTAKMRKAVQRFDAMTDGEQIDQLKAMWG